MRSKLWVVLKCTDDKRGRKIRNWSKEFSRNKAEMEQKIKEGGYPQLSMMFNNCAGMLEEMWRNDYKDTGIPFAWHAPYIKVRWSREHNRITIYAQTGRSEYEADKRSFEDLIKEIQALTNCADLELVGALYIQEKYPYDKNGDYDPDEYVVNTAFKKGWIKMPYF